MLAKNGENCIEIAAMARGFTQEEDQIFRIMPESGDIQVAKDWREAAGMSEENGHRGACDWRLPSEDEVKSMIASPEFDSIGGVFCKGQSVFAWTSTSASFSTTASAVAFDRTSGASVFEGFKNSHYSAYVIRQACNPDPFAVKRFEIDDNFIMDRHTGLMWDHFPLSLQNGAAICMEQEHAKRLPELANQGRLDTWHELLTPSVREIAAHHVSRRPSSDSLSGPSL